jgi:ABC-type multidrug transport system fused ATPase/permease subunit
MSTAEKSGMNISVQNVYTSTDPDICRKMIHDELSSCPPPTIRVMDKKKLGFRVFLGYWNNQCGEFTIGMFALIGG